ncbi:MAG: SsrA-binding protein SmpB [Patescibacteria group bacterium]
MAVLSENRKAYFNYEILETLEAGLELKGFEAKAIKAGRANLTGAFATIKDNEIWLTNADVPPYQSRNTPPDYEPTRPRRLLLNKKEIQHLISKMQSDRLTLVPLKLYTKGGRIKVELGLARGKRKYEKRETIKKRETQKEIRRTLKRG